MAERLRLEPYGPDAWLLHFADQPGEAAYQAGQALCRALEADPPPHLVEYVPGYINLLLEFAPGASPNPKALLKRLQGRLGHPVEAGPIREIPVIYDGPDLTRVADHNGLTIDQVKALHTAPLYRVALLGFAPGFPYLEGLDPRLHTPRLATPRPQVEAGSVAIGGSHAGIYSIASPGGWNLIGRTEVVLFDPARARPGQEADICWLWPGDRVRFVAKD